MHTQVSAPKPERYDAGRLPWGANLGHRASSVKLTVIMLSI